MSLCYFCVSVSEFLLVSMDSWLASGVPNVRPAKYPSTPGMNGHRTGQTDTQDELTAGRETDS